MKVIQFLTIMFVALSMGMAFCHLLEMPVRLDYDPGLWSTVTNVEGTYRFFRAPVGAALEGGAWISAVVLAFVSRRRRGPALALKIVGAGCMVIAHVVWWLYVFPVNSQMLYWTPDSLPPNFDELRRQWEYTHAARAILQIISLGSIVASILVQPSDNERAPKAYE